MVVKTSIFLTGMDPRSSIKNRMSFLLPRSAGETGSWSVSYTVC